MLYTTLSKFALLLAAQLGSVISEEQQRVLGPNTHDLDQIRQRLLDAEIIPDIIDDFPPALALRASWKHDSADLGNTLKPHHLSKSPSVRLEKVETDSSFDSQLTRRISYAIALTDPDAPSRDDPKWSEFCHWIATGHSVSSSSDAVSHRLKDVVEYKAPAPPPKTGKHRYVFFAFVAANGTTKRLHLTRPEDRKHWGSDQAGHGVREWAHDNGLVPVENEEQ
ncbi:hypothetical protein F66182_768 [Fusarium sp. NRRL 66182]|nr:hypothetical protein F66182_768 [Fusarium sp. NRRL 66182]